MKINGFVNVFATTLITGIFHSHYDAIENAKHIEANPSNPYGRLVAVIHISGDEATIRYKEPQA